MSNVIDASRIFMIKRHERISRAFDMARLNRLWSPLAQADYSLIQDAKSACEDALNVHS